jgi:DHA1 family tetracycline resistance protein-like MFS transporter
LELPVPPVWRLRVPFLVAAGFSTVAWVLVLLRLPEPAGERLPARVLSWRGLADTVSLPGLALLMTVGALVVLAFAALEGTFSLYLESRLGWSATQASLGFVFLGLVSLVVQGGFIRHLVPRFGERALAVAGIGLLAIGLAGLAVAGAGPAFFGATFLVGVGQGLASPSILGLLSRSTPATEQGAVFGVYSSAQTLARMTNYYVANRLLGLGGPSLPYWEGAIMALLALGLAAVGIRPGPGTPQSRMDRYTSTASERVGLRPDGE